MLTILLQGRAQPQNCNLEAQEVEVLDLVEGDSEPIPTARIIDRYNMLLLSCGWRSFQEGPTKFDFRLLAFRRRRKGRLM